MYEVLVEHLRGCAKLDKSNNTYTEAADAIEELADWWAMADKLMKMLEMPHWIPVTERLPESVCKSYLCLTDTGYHCEVRWTNNIFGFGESDRWGWSIFDVPQYCKVTHWMPLPKPPKEE